MFVQSSWSDWTSGHVTSQLNQRSALLACCANWFNQVCDFLLPLDSLCAGAAVGLLLSRWTALTWVFLTGTLQELLWGQVPSGQIPVYRESCAYMSVQQSSRHFCESLSFIRYWKSRVYVPIKRFATLWINQCIFCQKHTIVFLSSSPNSVNLLGSQRTKRLPSLFWSFMLFSSASLYSSNSYLFPWERCKQDSTHCQWRLLDK